jgi:hypothetical protein
MKVYAEETNSQSKQTFVVILDRKEAQTLVEMSEEAARSNKRKTSFRNMKNKFVRLLSCY